MRVISPRPLRDFSARHADAEGPIRAWLDVARKATWKTPNELKRHFPTASFVGNDRVVFNIKGNSYRLVVKIDFAWQLIFIRFIGTHGEYDKIDATTI